MIANSEYLRKVIHLFNLIIPIGYHYLFTDKWQFFKIILFTTFCVLFIDICRNFIPFFQSIFSKFFNSMLREHELRGKLIGLIMTPAQKIAFAIKEPGAQLARLVSMRSSKLEESK